MRQLYPEDWIWQQDGSGPHHSNVVQDCLDIMPQLKPRTLILGTSKWKWSQRIKEGKLIISIIYIILTNMKVI